jgi:predicted DNA-binding transcriptional regulator AlpA
VKSEIREAVTRDHVLWQINLAERWGFDPVTVYRMKISGRLPPPDLVLGRRSGWYESTIREFEAQTRNTTGG